jgi:hypothetical protein
LRIRNPAFGLGGSKHFLQGQKVSYDFGQQESKEDHQKRIKIRHFLCFEVLDFLL